MIAQTKPAGERRHFIFAMVYRSRGELQSSHIETCWIEIIRPKTKSLFICSAHRPPDFNIETLIEKLKNDLSEIQVYACRSHPKGGFQCRPPTEITCLQTLARALSLEQLITSLNRITQSSKDLIFAKNVHYVIASEVYSLDVSDHSLIFCVIKASVAKSEGRFRDINYRCYKNYDQHKSNNDLTNVD